MDALANARDYNPKHNVTRRVDIALCPGRGALGPHNREHRIQVLADISCDDYLAKLNLGRRVQSSSVNTELLKSWICACVYVHGDKCTPAKYETARGFTLRLVDLRRRCVVIAPDDCEYVALSYTWGDSRRTKHLKLTKDSSCWLQTEGALADENENVPTTIKDALYVADLL